MDVPKALYHFPSTCISSTLPRNFPRCGWFSVGTGTVLDLIPLAGLAVRNGVPSPPVIGQYARNAIAICAG